MPDVREERIERLRQALDSGQYHIESEQIADALIRDTFLNTPPA
ncbi:MAG: flagellar biosynthesis anti-sigma factor FlgM [Nitrospirales bacterium]